MKKEHKRNIRKPSDEHNVITKHIIKNEHQIDWEKVQILDRENHSYKWDVSEMALYKNLIKHFKRAIRYRKCK